MLIRVQSREGTKRIECDINDKVLTIFDKVKDVFKSNTKFKLFKERNSKNEIKSTTTTTVGEIGLQHGTMIFLVYEPETDSSDVNVGASTSNCTNYTNGNISPPIKILNKLYSTQEDEIDTQMWKSDGLIERPRDAVMCKHGDNAKCVSCMPLEPFDEEYLKENKIKHLSFHSYLRKQTRGIDKGKFAALENISCKIKEECTGHLPWPKGICTKCQPTAVTLSRQTYRHVDNVMFENASIVEQFLNYWRTTGHQRIGFLYGYYEPHKVVPLGIKAIVVAIYEPPQESSMNHVKLTLPDPSEKVVNDLAHELGLKCVGWIFTDLISEDPAKGTVKHIRNVDNHFLSAQECIMAGHFQTSHPNPCKLSNEGYFGSKFVTVIITGNKSNQIHMEGYQVSNQCMALVRDNCLLPTKDAPELAYVKETSKEQYVPDVFFTEKDKFNNEIKQIARLLPVEYLLIDVPVSTPLEQKFTFNANINKKPFCIENRMIENHLQDFNSLSQYLSQFSKEEFLDALKDFHFLIYLNTMDMISFKNDMKNLLYAIKKNDKNLALEWSKNENWATLEQLIEAQKNVSPIENNVTSVPSTTSNKWSCQHCTFENTTTKSNCEMCNLPRHF